MTRPTTSQIDAYCAALKAFYAGERVEFRCAMTNRQWVLMPVDHNFPSFASDYEYHIAPAPPKLRDFYLSREETEKACEGGEFGKKIYIAGCRPMNLNTALFIHVREVSETADAEIAELRRKYEALREQHLNHEECEAQAEEMAELRRNHDALCAVIREFGPAPDGSIQFLMDKHGAILK